MIIVTTNKEPNISVETAHSSVFQINYMTACDAVSRALPVDKAPLTLVKVSLSADVSTTG